MNDFDVFDEAALIDRLTSAIRKRKRDVIFLVGSPFSAPLPGSTLGVPIVDGVVQIIREEFSDDLNLLNQLDLLISNSQNRRYQEAFRFLHSRRGPNVANELVRSAVLSACSPESRYRAQQGEDQACLLLESEESLWTIGPGTLALASLTSIQPDVFGRAILTTNFDPLIEIAITRTGGRYYRTIMQGDGDLSNSYAPGCQVVHLHGYWYGSTTLHTVRQLTQPRPALKASLSRLLKRRLVVVCGYGGWDDIFTATLFDLAADSEDDTEILWATHNGSPQFPDETLSKLQAAIHRGKIFIYSGVDCNVTFPKLADWWQAKGDFAGDSTHTCVEPVKALSPISVSIDLAAEIEKGAGVQQTLEGDDEDRPPLIEFCLGRDEELRQLESSTARAFFIAGMGGQGKSTLAAKYFGHCQRSFTGETFIWRDCKEEGERFENQLASVIESLSGGRVRGLDLAKQDVQVLVEILIPYLANRPSLFVFDNVDHYIDLESERLTPNVEAFVKAVLERTSQVKVVFTSRPSIGYEHPDASTIKLEGISFAATRQLFSARGSKSGDSEILEAHSLTQGHAFWLDLLAIQTAKDGAPPLRTIVEEVRSGHGDLPTNVLQSTWAKLHEREQIVLRAMAETVRPERENQIADYVRSQLTFQKVFRALRSLRKANLVVVKRLLGGEEVLELHPLLRTFIRKNFSKIDRLTFIDSIIRVYKQFIGTNRKHLDERPTFILLQNWTQAAELSLAAGRIQAAYQYLGESINAFASSAYPREFARVARLLLSTGDFVEEYKQYKYFDRVFRAHIRILSYLGELDEVDSLLNKYALTVPDKDARFIGYCHMRAYTYWVRRSFSEAVEWGKRGAELKTNSQVDTEEEIEHTLALGMRDAGMPDVALPTFLAGQTLEEVTDPDEFDEQRGGAHYGNVGRCLHFMGDLQGALVCYQKSGLIIEKDYQHEHILNQGFIRLWVGEIFIALNRSDLAEQFLEAARRKWEQVNPPAAKRIEDVQQQLSPEAASLKDRSKKVEALFQDWLFGKLN